MTKPSARSDEQRCMRYSERETLYLEVVDSFGDGAAEESDLDLLGLLHAADGDLEEHLICHLQCQQRGMSYELLWELIEV